MSVFLAVVESVTTKGKDFTVSVLKWNSPVIWVCPSFWNSTMPVSFAPTFPQIVSVHCVPAAGRPSHGQEPSRYVEEVIFAPPPLMRLGVKSSPLSPGSPLSPFSPCEPWAMTCQCSVDVGAMPRQGVSLTIRYIDVMPLSVYVTSSPL